MKLKKRLKEARKGEKHLVPLSRQAIKILKTLHPLTGNGKFLFPSMITNLKPISDNTINQAIRRMGYDKDEMTAHGFRAMARTILDEILHVKPEIIEHQLAHVVRDALERAYMHEVLTGHGHGDTPSLFDSYAITGGLPKYLEMLAENKSLTLKKMLDFILKPHSPFLAEGKNLLVEEFGREYGTYFSILELISVGKTARSEIVYVQVSDLHIPLCKEYRSDTLILSLSFFPSLTNLFFVYF